jgi:hypothetical protein
MHFNCRSPADFAFDFDMSTALFDETIHLTKTEARSLTDRLGRKKGSKTRSSTSISIPGIGDRDQHMFAARYVRLCLGIVLVEHLVGGPYREPAASLHGVTRIEREVQNRAVKLIQIDEGPPEIWLNYGFYLDISSQSAAGQIGHGIQQASAIGWVWIERLAPRKPIVAPSERSHAGSPQ